MKKQFAFILLTMFTALLMTSCAPGSTIQINTPVPNPGNGTTAPGQITVPAVSFNVNAPGPNPLMNQPAANGQTAGALMGLWHGFISPVTMLLSFVNPNVQMVEVNNDGSAYSLGFFLGMLILVAVAGGLIYSRR